MDTQDYNTGQFITVDEAIISLLSREKDIAGVNKLHYKDLAPDVFRDMNLSAIKQTRRILFAIDPWKKSISFPEEFYSWSTISGVNENGMLEPLSLNTNVPGALADLALDRNCESECGCTDAICNYSKHYETITEEVTAKMPDDTDQTFTKVIRKYINKDGSAYLEVTEPEAIYTSGTHTTTELKTVSKFLCKLNVKSCGCIIDNDYNRDTWAKFGSNLAVKSKDDIMAEWGAPICGYYSAAATYNFKENNRGIEFPNDFPYKKVLARIYVTDKTKNLLLPYIAKEAFLSGIKRLSTKFDKNASQGLKEEWKGNYNADMNKLRLVIGKLMLNEYFDLYFGVNTMPDLYYNDRLTYSDEYYPY